MPTPSNPYLAGLVTYLALGILGAHWAVAAFVALSVAIGGRIRYLIAQRRAERLFSLEAIAMRADYEWDNPSDDIRTYGQYQPEVR